MKKTSIEKYNQLIKKYHKLRDKSQNNPDIEGIHIMQDNIYVKFISDIHNNKIPVDEIKPISTIISNTIVKDHKKLERWYA